MEKEEVLHRLNSACKSLLEHDRELLVVDANERSMTHKLAEHLQVEFPDWNVDCEYNRKGQDPKRLVRTNRRVFPDVIVHHRGTTDNLVVIEAKKSSARGAHTDRNKLREYKTDYGYKFAFAVIFPVGTAASSASTSIDIKEVL